MRHIPIERHGQSPRSRCAPVRHRLSRRLVRTHSPVIECCEQRLLLSTSTWIGGAHTDSVATSGDPNAWSNPLNWLGGVPGPGDTAEFTDNVTFSLPNHTPGQPPVTFQHPFNESPNDDVNASAVISVDSSWGGTITVENGITLTLTGSGTWNGGTLATATGGTLLNSSTATLTLQNPSTVVIAGTFTNAGTFNVDGSGAIQMAGATFDNESSGTYDIETNQGLVGDNSLADNFTNSGLVEQTAGTGTTDLITSLSNTGGTIDIETGTFEWDGNNGVSTGGTFDASPGAVLQYGVGDQSNTWSGTYNGGGGGSFVQNSGAEIAIGSSGATFDFAPGLYQWQGGDIVAANTSATLTNNGTISLILNEATSFQSSMILNAGITLDNFGAIDHSGAASFVFRSSAMVNEPGGVYNFESDAGWNGFGNLTGTITNEGLIEKTAGTGQSVINVVLDNQGGTLDAQTGTLIPWNGNGSVSTGGTLDAASGALIQYNTGDNSSNTFTGTYTGSGGGQFLLTSDNLVIGTNGATFDFPSGFFQWIGGGQLQATAGTLTNAGFITVDTSDGGNASFSGTLANSGTITFQSSGSSVGAFDGGTVNNPSGSVINLNGVDSQAHDAPLLSSTVNNSGTINSNSSSSVSIAVLNNTGGTLDVQSGTLVPWNGNGAASTGGTFEAAGGATIQYNPGDNTNNTFTGTYTGSGAGQFVLNSDNLVIGAGGATFDFPSGFFKWVPGGQITATSGVLTNNGFITVDTTGGGGASLSGTLDNSSTGTITFQDSTDTVGFFGGGTVNNASGGVIDIDGIDPGLPLVDTTLNNSGTVNSRSSASVSITSLNNTGTVAVASGTLDADSVTQVSSQTLTGGTWDVSGGSTLSLQNGTALTTNNAAVLLDGAGSIVPNFANQLAANGGSLTVQDGAKLTTPGAFTNTGMVTIGNNGSVLTTTGNYSQSGSGSLTSLQGGTLKPISSTAMVNGGAVTGSGTIEGSVTNAAIFEPGTTTAGGTIEITGNYAQTAAGALDIGLAGAASGQFGQLAVTGTASLNGALNLTLLSGFVPTDTQSFEALAYGTHSGTFPTVTGTRIPNNETLTTEYTGVDLCVGVAGISSSPPTSTVSALPAVTTTTSFTVSWSGSPGAGATSIASFEIFVSKDGGPFTPFLTSTTQTSATFAGQIGNTYGFFSVATDNLGHVQPTPTAAQATTKVVKVTVPPPAIVTSVEWTTIPVKIGSGKKAKTKSEPAVQITFSEPVSGTAHIGAYELSNITTKTVKKKPITTLKPIALSLAVPASSPMTTSVKLLVSGKVKVGQTDQLEIIAADITDAEGRALDGNDDGKPGANFIGKFGSGGLAFARPMSLSTPSVR